MLSVPLREYRYRWPDPSWEACPLWREAPTGSGLLRILPESPEELTRDSRWPAFFPSPIGIVTAGSGSTACLEKVVGPCIVNRFPYVLMLSFCRAAISPRHYPRAQFMEALETAGSVAVQFLPSGRGLDTVLQAITSTDDSQSSRRLRATGLGMRKGVSNDCPVFDDAYLVYEGRMVRPGADFEGRTIHLRPWKDIGSHRAYFLEICAIQLRQDIAAGRTQILWRSLPFWTPRDPLQGPVTVASPPVTRTASWKTYTPDYRFPAAGTTAFAADETRDGMAVKYLSREAENQVELDNDRARWPCFFPSSVGIITARTTDGVPNLMPCGSTAVVSRSPLTIACCICYAAVNVRYSPRMTLQLIRESKRFGYAVAFSGDAIVSAINYCGNVSLALDRQKVAHSGLKVIGGETSPVLPALPIHYDCRLVEEVRLGTHSLLLGEVQSIRLRSDVTAANPLEWYPWADVRARQ